MLAGHAAKKYALRLKALLPNTSQDISVSSDDLLPRRPSALLVEALKRSLVLINIADDCLPGASRILPSKLPETFQRRNINEKIVIEQGSEKITKSGPSIENIDLMAGNPFSDNDHEKDPRNAALLDRSFGETSSKSIESSLFSTDLSALSEDAQWTSQGNPQKYDDHLRSAGNALALTYNIDCGALNARASLAAWICKLSLAGDEHSVNNLESLLR